MTSTTGGGDRPSFGWIGRSAIASGVRQPHMNVFGGEDRFWLGPEGGQFALFFRRGDPFDLDHWQVPEPIDWGSWEATNQTPAEARFRKRMTLTNYSGTRMDIEVDADAGSIHPFRRPGPVRELDVEIQREPYQGDVVNSYNDGPPAAGQAPLGPFFELETSSPALDLLPAQRYTHVHRTLHLVGTDTELDHIARATIGVGLEELTNAFSPQR